LPVLVELILFFGTVIVLCFASAALVVKVNSNLT